MYVLADKAQVRRALKRFLRKLNSPRQLNEADSQVKLVVDNILKGTSKLVCTLVAPFYIINTVVYFVLHKFDDDVFNRSCGRIDTDIYALCWSTQSTDGAQAGAAEDQQLGSTSSLVRE